MPRPSARPATWSRDAMSARCPQAGTPRRMAASTSLWAISARSAYARNSRAWSKRCGRLRLRPRERGLVEVVPTRHYMMGGVEFRRRLHDQPAGSLRCRRGFGRRARREPPRRQMALRIPPCSARSPGDTMAAWVRKHGELASVPGLDIERYERSFGAQRGDLERIQRNSSRPCGSAVGHHPRRRWLATCVDRIGTLEGELQATGIGQRIASLQPGLARWLNLQSLISVSRAIAQRACPRGLARCALPRMTFPNQRARDVGPIRASVPTAVSR